MAAAKPKKQSRFRVRTPADVRASKSGTSKSKTKSSKTTKASASKAKTKETAKAASAKTSAKTAKGKTPPADIPGRIDGLRGWLEEIERKQGRMQYFGGAGLLIAIAASGAALYFGITTHNDSATKSDLDEVKKDIAALRTEVEQSAQSKKSLDQTVTSLQQQLKSVQAKQAQTDQQLNSLRNQATTTPPATSLPTPGVTPPTTTTP